MVLAGLAAGLAAEVFQVSVLQLKLLPLVGWGSCCRWLAGSSRAVTLPPLGRAPVWWCVVTIGHMNRLVGLY